MSYEILENMDNVSETVSDCQTKCLNICEEKWQININKLRDYAT